MALNPRKRQKKLERRKAKEKSRNKVSAVRQTHSLTRRFERAADGRILDCLTPSILWDQGIGNVLFSREFANGRVAHATFLVDIFCLGVKNVALGVSSRERYSQLVFDRLFADQHFERRAPGFIRKLVEESVVYARALGIEPHADYDEAKAIFGDVEAGGCREHFVFGRHGKPFFVSGPHDAAGRCAWIMNLLTEHCGPGGFDYLLHVSQRELIAAGLARFVLPG